MSKLLKQYCPRTEFKSYDDFMANFKIDMPDNFNFGYDIVDKWAQLEPDKLALRWISDTDEVKDLTFSDIAQISDLIAAGLQQLGVCKGDRVLFMLRQRWEYWCFATALNKLGAVIIPATIQLTAKDLIFRANAAQVKAIVAIDSDYVTEQMAQALPQLESAQSLLFINEAKRGMTNIAQVASAIDHLAQQKGHSKQIYEFDSFVEGAQKLPAWQRPDVKSAEYTTNDDIMLIYFTSGTTGPAKMACHNFLHPLGHIITAKYWQQVQEDKLHLSVTDSGWAKFGWGKIYGQWICGAPILAYDATRFEPKNLLQVIDEYKPTTFCVPPTMYRFLLHEQVGDYDLSSVANFTTAGEPLNAEVTTQWQKLTGQTIREGFGQSEGPVLVATFPWVEPRAGSMGKPSPLLNLKLLDEQGTPVERGEEGHMCVTGLSKDAKKRPPGLFVGYYNDEVNTEKALGGSYYDLSDVAWQDNQGYLTFVGRSDDVIKCSGYRIGPFEVESALIEHKAVLECAVTGAPDPDRGQVVKATIVLAPGFAPSDELTAELQAHVKQTTAPYKYPRIVEYTAELPKTIGGKIKRAQMRAQDEGKLTQNTYDEQTG